MASPPPATTKASRWGSFITGLESRLDTILADEESASKVSSEMAASEQANKKDSLVESVVQTGSADSISSNIFRFPTTSHSNARQVRAVLLRLTEPKIVSMRNWHGLGLLGMLISPMKFRLRLRTCHQGPPALPM